MSFGDEEREEEELATEEAKRAAAEAGEIGGDVPVDSDDPAERPLIEAGEGEDEGFELAERELGEADDELEPD